MKKLVKALFAAAFAVGSVPVLAAGSGVKPSTGVNTKKAADAAIDMQPLSTLDNDQIGAGGKGRRTTGRR
jgi:hypothetical protein